MARLPRKHILDADRPEVQIAAQKAATQEAWEKQQEEHYQRLIEELDLPPSEPERFKDTPEMSEAKRRYLTYVHQRAKAAT
jgi:hypothetical protein